MNSQPRKRFAQHWLNSEAILHKIIKASNLQSTDRVLEIGPGTGILTRQLITRAEAVVSVEIDRDLCKKLAKKFGEKPNFLLLQGDILSLNLEDLLSPYPLFQNPNKVVANIPYNITGPILEKLLGKIASPVPKNYESIVLLVQKEVADRLVAHPSTKAFGALSVRVQYLADCELICPVPAKAFYPPPKVESAVIRLTPRSLEQPALNPRHLEQIVTLGFSSKRKMLRNNLKSMIESDRLTPILEQLNINPQARAEDLSLENWVQLSNTLQDTPL
ncbi:16S rRNA (adenine(1518)-N(6)/adenine(1519)-N(6))-dimethyltransferase RsmA [Roseofilum sp. BLCC_M91]|uniref:Ribosomal RNA small subunit methyltransferase A n=1 Tax=Roseofilum halophilum BLCC-M91 TaxID=3022259 RepID=A0ABT7BE12_9CYAN|nr:16S rRNA (adenine(1518)-N(6)/adenine(1519)-N(6))-dimethyltransferase RsmA [Roseofilum halophilum]MDJ1177416.1 16S rRNA (adenine(1518)-N(6)/adenine(1519)-N(6))-dimethyltransferase RsmA [Roseofilum halophilum BLCC-M91]